MTTKPRHQDDGAKQNYRFWFNSLLLLTMTPKQAWGLNKRLDLLFAMTEKLDSCLPLGAGEILSICELAIDNRAVNIDNCGLWFLPYTDI